RPGPRSHPVRAPRRSGGAARGSAPRSPAPLRVETAWSSLPLWLRLDRTVGDLAELKLFQCPGPVDEALHLDRLLGFEVLVDAEEMGDLVAEVLGDVVDVAGLVPLGVVL